MYRLLKLVKLRHILIIPNSTQIQSSFFNRPTMDKIFIQGLALHALIGVYDFERVEKQRIILDLELETDLTKAAVSDNVNDTLDYGKLALRLEEVANQSSYKLLEALANEMMQVIFNEFKPKHVRLVMHKPDILDNTNSVGIIFERHDNQI